MTERENCMHVIRRDGLAQWVPVAPDVYNVVGPAPVADRPLGGVQKGQDWFGVWWTFDPAPNAYMLSFDEDPLLDDITEWRDKVVFPDVDSIDWESASDEAIRSEVRRVIDLFWPTQSLILTLPYILPGRNRDVILDEARSYGGSPKAR